MGLQRNNEIRSILSILLMANLFRSGYQHEVLSIQLTLRAADDVKNTLGSFLNEAGNRSCLMDPYILMDLYSVLKSKSGEDCTNCNKLLSHNIRKSLIESSVNILENAIISQTLNTSVEVQRLSTKLTELDWRIADAVWERSIDAVYLFVDILELNEALNQLDNFESRVVSLMQLYTKRLRMDEADHAKLAVRKVFLFYEIYSYCEFNRLPDELRVGLKIMYDSWPKQLHHLYQSLKNENQIVGILNIAHWEFLYAPRAIGPNGNKRVPYTWYQYKNETDSDCNLFLTYNDNGEVSIGNQFNTGIKYLYVDEDDQMPYFWINQGLKPNRWWKMEWYEHGQEGDYYTFTNVNTNQLLCATTLSDGTRRHVTLLYRPKKDVAIDSECRWNFRWNL